jgi:four helix bundle protein
MQQWAMEGSMVNSFRDLHVWQKAIDLADSVYAATGNFPRDERFGLSSQLRRAAVSIPSNIAEGRAIGGGRFLHHLRIALGSEAELETQIELAKRRGYVTDATAASLTASAAEIGRMLHSLHRNVKAQEIRRRAAS